jgi:hypothetical protein
MGRAEPGDSQSIINEWEGHEWFSGQVRAVCAIPEPGMGNLPTHTILNHVFFMSP